MIAGVLELQMRADLARLVSDMDKAKRTVGDTVSRINGILGAIGVGVSFAGLVSMVKSVVNVGDHLNDLSKITGLTVIELGGLGKAAKLNGTDLDSVAKAIGLMSKNMYAGSAAFSALGINTKDASGQLRDANQVFLDVADRFSRMQDGATKSALAAEVFGKSGRDLIPMLNEGRAALEGNIDSYAKYSGMSKQTAEASDRFNDTLSMLQGRVTAIKTSFVGELLPTLNSIGTAMLATGQSTSQFSFAASVVVPILKGLAIAGAGVVGIFQGVGREIGAAAAQMAAMARFDFQGVGAIAKALAQDHKNADIAFDKYVKTIMDGDKSVDKLTQTQKEYLKIEQQVPAAVEKTTRAMKEKKVVTDAEQLALLRQNESTKQTIALGQRVASITDSVATEQEKYNQKLEELNRLKPYLSVETYNRALEKAQAELKGTAVQTRKITDEVSQLWMQAGRNIQSTLANSIFNFFDDGLKGMLKNVISTVGRIASEFAALKIAQSIGLSQMFGGGIGGIGAAAGGASLLSNVGSGAGIMGTLKNFGGGITSGISGLMSGGGVGALALPLLGGFALNSMSNAFAGDKTLGNGFTDFMQKIPILGAGWDILAGFFGREPYKFRQQSIQGTASADGFDGDISNVFRSQGGVFSKNKHRTQTEEFSKEQQAIFDGAIGGFYTSARGFVDNLGMSADLVDNFSKEVQIKSEKGKTVTEEAIEEMIAGIGDSLAKNVLPNVEDFKRVGETTINTLSRLSGEFSVLTNAAALLFDKSADWSKNFVNQFGFGARSAFLEQAGGADAFAGMVSGFAQNFLTDDQRMKPVIESILKQRDSLGLGNINTREQFVSGVQSGKLNQDQMIFLLQNQGTIKTIFDYLDSKNQGLAAGGQAVDEVKAKAIDMTSILNNVAQGFGAEIERITGAIGKLKDFSKELAASVLQIQPMSRNEAFQKLINYASAAASGGDMDINDIKAPINTLTNLNSNEYSSNLDFARDKARSTSTINSLISISTSKQADMSKRILELQGAMVSVMNDIAASSRLTAENIDSVTEGGSQMRTA